FTKVAPNRRPVFGRYWDPRPSRLTRPTPEQVSEHAERLRALLISNLTRDLHPENGNLLTLSGGVDSSCLGALAAGVVGRKVWSWSAFPPGEAEYQRESGYVRRLAERYSFERRWQVRRLPGTYLEALETAPRIGFPAYHNALCALPMIMRN